MWQNKDGNHLRSNERTSCYSEDARECPPVQGGDGSLHLAPASGTEQAAARLLQHLRRVQERDLQGRSFTVPSVHRLCEKMIKGKEDKEGVDRLVFKF